MPRQIEQKPLLGKFRFTSTIILETGLHVGGGGDNLDIGGLDKPVIRDPLTQYPYIPGSSIKGKLRSILERLFNKPLNRLGGSDTYRYESGDLEDGYTEVSRERFIFYQGAKNCPISRVFGSTGVDSWIKASVAREQELFNNNTSTRTIEGAEGEYAKIKGRNSPARLIVRDCHLLEKSAERLKKVDTGLYMTEWKFENSIDRVTAAANPRQFERVPADSRFNFEMVYTLEDKEQAIEDLKNIAIALAILEDDALGGHGSRGYGKVRFENFKFIYCDYEAYRINLSQGITDLDRFCTTFEGIEDTKQLLQLFNNLPQMLLPPQNTNNE